MKVPRYINHSSRRDHQYELREDINYYSERYDKSVFCKKGDESDGATGAFDIRSSAWWVHDQLCETGRFADGTKCTNWQASTICSDILKSEGRWFRARTWFAATWFAGGCKARDNGMW